MNAVKFCKFHGFGNDYLVVEKSELRGREPAELAMAMCHRHTGAGADGIAILAEYDGEEADYSCEIINPDGSIAGFSGNGSRCAAAYLYFKNIWSRHELRLKMSSGIKNFTLLETLSPGHYWFEAEIGKPKFASDQIPVAAEARLESVVNRSIPVGDRWVNISAVSVGNPVVCTFVSDFDLDWRELGKALESHEAFPERANVVFVKVLDTENIELRIWERGAGETAASGTCASGAAVLSAFLEKTERTVSVHSPGGVTEVHWRDDDEILLTGRADLIYCGEWPI